MRGTPWCAVWCGLVLAAGCQDESSERGGTVTDALADATAADALEVLNGDTGYDAADAAAEVDAACGSPAELFCGCEEPADCASGICIASRLGGDVCSRACVESCPEGWQCKALALGGSDPSFVCVDRGLLFCRPCRSQADCQYTGFSEPGDRCVDRGPETGAFCGLACADDGDCPDGSSCQDALTLGSDEHTRQCVPTSGECACSGRATLEAAATDCHRGACAGTRACGADGLTACDAPEASAEVCDGADNDCDGATDEGSPDLDGDQLADCVDLDDDFDGVPDEDDVCPLVADPEQLDSDDDGKGDACDPPGAPLVLATHPVSPSPVNHVEVFGAGEKASRIEVFRDGACTAPAGTTVVDADGTWVAEWHVADDTTTTFWARAANAAGLASGCSSTSVTYVEDSTAPALPTFVGTTPTSPSQTITNPIITGLAEAHATVRLYKTAACTGAVAATTEVGGQGVFLASVEVLPDSTTRFWATATDLAGNTSACSTSSIVYTHYSGPVETHITSGPSSPSTSTAATFWFIANVAEATFACRLDAAAFAPCDSPRAFTGLAQGEHTFAVRATDRDGNVDPTPATFTWTIDTTPPQTALVSYPPDPSNDPTPTFGFTVSDSGSTTVCRIDAQPFVVCTSPWTTPSLGDGPHTVYLLSTDPAGNQEPVAASYTWRLDTDPPETTLTPVGLADPSALASATFILGSDEVGSFACALDGSPTSCPTQGVMLAVGGLVDRRHTLTVTAIDKAGNADPTPATWSWTSDTAAPDTIFDGVLPPSTSSQTDVAFAFHSDDATASFECALNGAYGPCASPWQRTLGSGVWTFSVRAVDPAGNRDPTPASYTFTVDATDPDTYFTSVPPSLWNRTSATFGFASSAPDVVAFRCWVDGDGPVSCASPRTESGLDQGLHTFEVAAVDAVGNEDPTPASWVFTIDSLAPSAPTGLVAEPGNRTVHLRWDPVADATRYRVALGPVPGASPLPRVIETTATSLDVDQLANCTTYVFEVRAVDAADNESGPSARASATPVLPSPTYRVVGGQGTVAVSWSAVPFATGYRVFYGPSPGTYTGSAARNGASPLTVASPGAAVALAGLPADVDVYVALAAVDGACESARGPEWRSDPYPWDWVSPSPTGNTLRDVDCVGAACVAVGHVGTVLARASSGAPWTRQNGGTGTDLVDVDMVSASVVVAVGGSVIHRSTDGGKTFAEVLDTGAALDGVSFAGDVGWVVGAGGRVYRSVDGGASWVAQSSKTSGDLSAVFAVSASVAYAAGANGTLLATTDGSTWTAFDLPVLARVRDLACRDATHCWAVGDDGIVVRTDDGATWSTVYTGVMASFERVVVVSATEVHAVGQATLASTTNDGASWTSRALLSGEAADDRLFGLLSVGGGGLLAVGEKGALLAVTATTATRVGGALGDGDLRAVASASGGLVAVGAGAILRSTDGGATWSAAATPAAATAQLRDVTFGTAADGLAVGDNATVLATADGGATWSALAAPGGHQLRGVSCLDAARCWIGTGDSVVLKTSDGGQHWAQKSLSAYGAYDIAFVDEDHGFAVIDNQYAQGSSNYTGVLYTIDGGTNWTSYLNYSSGRGLAMASATSGYYAGNSGSNSCVEKAGLGSGGGSVAASLFELRANGTWGSALSAGIDYAGDCFFAVTPRAGGKAYTVGTQGLIGRDLPLDQGWLQAPPPTRERDLFGVLEVTPGRVVAVGERGTVLVTATGGL